MLGDEVQLNLPITGRNLYTHTPHKWESSIASGRTDSLACVLGATSFFLVLMERFPWLDDSISENFCGLVVIKLDMVKLDVINRID